MAIAAEWELVANAALTRLIVAPTAGMLRTATARRCHRRVRRVFTLSGHRIALIGRALIVVATVLGRVLTRWSFIPDDAFINGARIAVVTRLGRVRALARVLVTTVDRAFVVVVAVLQLATATLTTAVLLSAGVAIVAGHDTTALGAGVTTRAVGEL